MSDDWTPQNDRQHPPFEPGNLLALRHGALSARLVDNDAAQLLEELRDAGTAWLADVDVVALESWAFAVATVRRLRGWLVEHGDLDDDGKPRHAHKLLIAWERRLDRATSALGLDPLSRSRLVRDTAVAKSITDTHVADIAAAGKERRLRALGPEDEPDGAA